MAASASAARAESPCAISSRYSRSRAAAWYATAAPTAVIASIAITSRTRFILRLSYRLVRSKSCWTFGFCPGRNFRPQPGSKFDTMISVKQAGAVGWSEVSSGEAALIQRCASGDEMAFSELVSEHQRMVVQLAINLLGDRDEALDL